MPVHIKIIFSIVVLAVAVAGYYFLDQNGQGISKYLSLFLGVFSVIAFWICSSVNAGTRSTDRRTISNDSAAVITPLTSIAAGPENPK